MVAKHRRLRGGRRGVGTQPTVVRAKRGTGRAIRLASPAFMDIGGSQSSEDVVVDDRRDGGLPRVVGCQLPFWFPGVACPHSGPVSLADAVSLEGLLDRESIGSQYWVRYTWPDSMFPQSVSLNLQLRLLMSRVPLQWSAVTEASNAGVLVAG